MNGKPWGGKFLALLLTRFDRNVLCSAFLLTRRTLDFRSAAPLLTPALPRPRGVSQVQNIHHFQRAPLTFCRTFVTFKEQLSHFVEHSLVFTMCLLKCEHSYTELKQILQILRDMRHVASGCVSKVLTPPWFGKLDLSDMQNIRNF